VNRIRPGLLTLACLTALLHVHAAGAAGAHGAAKDAALAPAARLQDQQRGEQVYARCMGCHAIEGNRTGPQHCGLFGRRAGRAQGFDGYSPALRASGIIWDTRSLDAFIKAPMQAVPGTAMGYDGVKDPRERADLITWLRVATRPGTACTVQR
jgi:cytochrome c